MRSGSIEYGRPRVEVAMVTGPVDVASLCAGAVAADCGAEAVFVGRTRAESHTDHGDLRALVYEAYESMAEGVIRGICQDAAAQHDGVALIRVRHTVGEVGLGEASVGVRVLAGHRDAAFGACRVVIDRLKREAPIWKREVWAGAETWQAGARA